MRRRRVRLLAAVLATVGLPGSVAFASSPWTRAKGEGFLQLAYYTIGPYDTLYQSSGPDFRLGREVEDGTAEALVEYGVTRNWTIFGILPYRLTETGQAASNPTIAPSTIAAGTFDRLGDVRVGARLKLIDRGYVLSGQLDVELPTGDFDPATGLSTGYDAFTVHPSVSAGKSWGRAYVFGYLGFDLRTDDFSDGWRTGFEGGYRFFDRLWAIGAVDVVDSFENGDIVLPQANLETGLYVNDQEYVALGAKLVVDLTRRIGLQLSAFGAASGNNVARSPQFGGGVFCRW